MMSLDNHNSKSTMCEFLLSSHLQCIPSCSIHQILANFWDMNSTGAVSQFRKRKRKLLACIYILQKRFVRPFHVVGMQRQKELYKSIMHMQSCCFASLLNQLLLCRSHYCCCCRCLNPIFNFFPCRSQFGLKVIGHLLLPLIGFFTCVFDSVIVSKYKMQTHIRTVMPVCMN